jgi:hypothetical protein
MAAINEPSISRAFFLLSEIGAIGRIDPETLRRVAGRVRTVATGDVQALRCEGRPHENAEDVYERIAALLELLADSGEKADATPGFVPVATGAQLPGGCVTHEAACKQCGARRIVTAIMLKHPLIGEHTVSPVCAECVADFVAASPRTGVEVYLQTKNGFVRAGGEMR